jgi:gamma-glutamyltranspeptidase
VQAGFIYGDCQYATYLDGDAASHAVAFLGTALIQRGHKVTSNANPGGAFGGFQGIMFDPRTGVLMGGSDVRKDGLAIGF